MSTFNVPSRSRKAAGDPGVQENGPFRKLLGREMVVRNDDVDPSRDGFLNGVDGRDPAVDGDDPLGGVLVEDPAQRLGP